MSDLSGQFRITQSLEHGEEPTTAFFFARVLAAEFAELRQEAWPTSERSLDRLGPVLFHSAGQGTESVVVDREGALVVAGLQGGYVHVRVAAPDAATATSVLEGLRELFPAPEPIARHDVPVAFWTYTPNGPMPSLRPIAVPEWDEIRGNYASETRARLDAIMRGFKPAHGGQLILWHGLAGTGKTYALRALAWEWREWCQLHYVVDPDTFFGERADYLMGVLMQPPEMTMGVHLMGGGWTSYGPRAIFHQLESVDEDDEGDGDPVGGSKHWRLLVLEDTGELLTPDAKTIIGQGLSRFLNVVDGLIGQGLRVLVLVTTNEEIRALHPAVSRPGRCAANIDFTALPAEEAAAWLVEHGIDAEPDGGARILASLYAELEGFDPAKPQASVGFGAEG
jgi:hypothetical protein